jgi:hypothetical protein
MHANSATLPCRLTALSTITLFLARIQLGAFIYTEALPATCCVPPKNDYRTLPCSGLTFFSIKGRLIADGHARQSGGACHLFLPGQYSLMVDVR